MCVCVGGGGGVRVKETVDADVLIHKGGGVGGGVRVKEKKKGGGANICGIEDLEQLMRTF